MRKINEMSHKLSKLTKNIVESETQEVFDAKIDCLDDYFLFNVFSYFGVKEKLGVERVCKRWQKTILEMLEKQTGLGTTWSDDIDTNCLEANREHSVSSGDIRDAIPMSNGWMYDLTSEKALKNISFLAQKCPNVKCFHISHAIISRPAFEHLVELFPDFECLHLKGNLLDLSTKEVINNELLNKEWDVIGTILGPVITHLSIDPHYENRMNEIQIKNLIQHFKCLEEFRVGTHFERDVVGKFLEFLPKKCKLFYSLGRELLYDSLKGLADKNSKNITHLSYFSSFAKTHESAKLIGQRFTNLVKLKINLSFHKTILDDASPITELKQLKEFSIDLNNFTDVHVDDGLIWLIKDGLPSVDTLEISRACLTGRAFNSIAYCLPQLKELVLKSVEVQCSCTSEMKERSERYKCTVCKQMCWKSLSELHKLKSLQVLGFYSRTENPKPFHQELCDILPQLQSLRRLSIFRFDITSTTLFEALNKLMENTEPKDIFILELTSVPMTSKVKTPKVFTYRQNFML